MLPKAEVPDLCRRGHTTEHGCAMPSVTPKSPYCDMIPVILFNTTVSHRSTETSDKWRMMPHLPPVSPMDVECAVSACNKTVTLNCQIAYILYEVELPKSQHSMSDGEAS